MPDRPWTASSVKRRAVGMLVPYAGNARTHSPEQVAQIARSIREFGFVAPILIDETGEIIAGHGRLEAAISLSLQTVPTITREGLTSAQKAAYRLADNRIALNAGWDEQLLAAEVAKLQEMGDLDLALTGFDADEIDRLLATVVATADASVASPTGNAATVASADTGADPADADPEPPRQAVTRPGDLWLLGDHRLLCGDATHAATVARVMAESVRAALLFTSPPYGNQRDYTTGGGTDWDEGSGMTAATSITVRVPLAIRHRPGRKTVVTPMTDGVARVTTRADPALVKALARAFRYQRMLDEGRYASVTEMAAAEKIDRGYLGRLLQLTLLAPHIIEAILDGTQDGELTLPYLMAGIDVIWTCQPRPSPRPSKVPPKAEDAGRPASISAPHCSCAGRAARHARGGGR